MTISASARIIRSEFSPKYEKVVDCLIKDREALLAFFDFPAEHWKHLSTSKRVSRVQHPGTARDWRDLGHIHLHVDNADEAIQRAAPRYRSR